MKAAWVVVLVFVVLAGSAWAQFTPRELGMGSASIGVADDGAAWYQNPAGLGVLNIACPSEDKQWANDAIGAFADSDDFEGFAITWSGWKPASMYGWGAGFVDIDDSGRAFGAGYGSNVGDSPFSWGANVLFDDPDAGDEDTFFNLGAMYRFEQPERAPIRVGLTITDVTDESDNGPFFNLGVAWPATPELLLALDVEDVTDETDDGPYFDVGAEYVFSPTSSWIARAGLMDNGDDHDLTLGLGYVSEKNWRIDAAWANLEADDLLSIGAGVTF